MKHLFKINILLICFGAATSYAQNKVIHAKQLVSAQFDTLSHIKIDKIVFYQHPIYTKYITLTDTSYIPAWYKAYHAANNSEEYEDRIDDILPLFHSSAGVNKEKVISVINDEKTKGHTKAYQMYPHKYYFGEIWFTYLKTGEKMMALLDYTSQAFLPALDLNLPIQKQNWTIEECLDKDKTKSGSLLFFIQENGITKYANPSYVYTQVVQRNNSYAALGGLMEFKDMLYRVPTYIRSTIKDGKRIFETIENTPNGPVVKSVSDKP
jgi:hypothetical protein